MVDVTIRPRWPLLRGGIAGNSSAAYSERSTAKRINGRLKDEFGGRHRRGRTEVLCHLMVWIVALTVDQLMGLTL